MKKDNNTSTCNKNTAFYTPIKIKDKDKLINRDKYYFKINKIYFHSDYLNKIKNNNKYSINEIKARNQTSKTSRIFKMKMLINESLNKKKRKSFSIKSDLNINKYNKEKNINMTEIKKHKSNNDLREKKLFTYNFVKDTQRFHCSTIFFKRENKNKSHNKSNFDLAFFSNILKDDDKSNNFIKNKKLKKFLFKNKLEINTNNNSKYKKVPNIISKLKVSKTENKKITNDDINNFNKTKINVKLKKKLIDSPDSLFYYIYNYVNDKKNNIEQKIYYSKIDIEKKFRFYKKDLEKLEQRTNFEVYNLKRQIVPEQINNKKLPNFLSDI